MARECVATAGLGAFARVDVLVDASSGVGRIEAINVKFAGLTCGRSEYDIPPHMALCPGCIHLLHRELDKHMLEVALREAIVTVTHVLGSVARVVGNVLQRLVQPPSSPLWRHAARLYRLLTRVHRVNSVFGVYATVYEAVQAILGILGELVKREKLIEDLNTLATGGLKRLFTTAKQLDAQSVDAHELLVRSGAAVYKYTPPSRHPCIRKLRQREYALLIGGTCVETGARARVSSMLGGRFELEHGSVYACVSSNHVSISIRSAGRRMDASVECLCGPGLGDRVVCMLCDAIFWLLRGYRYTSNVLLESLEGPIGLWRSRTGLLITPPALYNLASPSLVAETALTRMLESIEAPASKVDAIIASAVYSLAPCATLSITIRAPGGGLVKTSRGLPG